MASEYTTHRRYPLYTDQDKPNLRDQYNGAIRMIDEDIDNALDASGHVSDALGAGFDAQHTVRMAIDETNAKFGSGISSSNTVTDELNNKADQSALSSEVTTRQNADTALSSRLGNGVTEQNTATAQLAALNTALSNETTARQQADTALSDRLVIVEGKYFAVIGDSFSEQLTEWPYIVASRTGLTVINKSAGGAGFSPAVDTSIPTFLQQLNSLKNDANFSKVIHVIVYGGVNDWYNRNHTSAQTIAYVDAFLESWSQISGKKPKLTFVFGNAGAPELPSGRTFYGYPKYVREVCSHIREAGYSAIEAYPFLMGYTYGTVFTSDYLHPNTFGEKIIASYMTQILNGTFNGVHNQYVKTEAMSGFAGGARLSIDGLNWDLQTRFRPTENLTVSTQYIEAITALPHVMFGKPGGHTTDSSYINTQVNELSVVKQFLCGIDGSTSQMRYIDVSFNLIGGGIFINRDSVFSIDVPLAGGYDFNNVHACGEIV